MEFWRLYRISVVQAIYISLFMGVTKNCPDPTPNLYKQCMVPIQQRGWNQGSVQSPFRVERVRSESSTRQDDFVNCAWPNYNQQLNIRTLRIPVHYVNKSRDKQTFKCNQESLIASLTSSLWSLCHFPNERLSFVWPFPFVFYTFM